MEENEEGSDKNVNQQEVELATSKKISIAGGEEREIDVTATDGDYWADLKVKYSFSPLGETFTCNALKYRAKDNGRSSGNVKLVFSGENYWAWELIKNAKQDGDWHDISGGGDILPHAKPNIHAVIRHEFIYDRYGVSDPVLKGLVAVNYIPRPLSISSENETFDPVFDVEGGNALPGATVYVRYLNSTTPTSGDANGVWRSRVTIPAGANGVAVTAWQSVKDIFSDITSIVVQLVVKPVTIDSPKAGDVITVPKPTVSGKGHSGATIRIYESGNGAILYGSGNISNGSWSIPLTVPLPNRRITLIAKQTFNGVDSWSNEVPITVAVKLQTPVITSPAAGSVQNSAFTVAGTGGVAGSIMRIVYDLDHSKQVGQAPVSGDSWTVPVTVDSGRRSLVAGQTGTGINPSDFSQPRAFDIRPPALTKVNVTVPSATTVKFDGDGHEGATVVITLISGPGGAAPGEAKVVSGKWETSATNWPDGLYKMSAIQKVSNNAGGWIESVPFPFEYLFKFPPPSDVGSTPDYSTTLSGKGVSGATVSFYDPDGTTKIAPDAQVGSDGQWSSKAYVEWGPTYDRIVRIRQTLNAQQSDFVEHKVRIPPIAPGIDSVSPDGLSPRFTGTCELNAQVNLVFSGSATSYPAVVTGTKWSFQRPEPFTPDIEHTVTATQIAAQQPSPAAVQPFQLYRPMVPVVITHPAQDSEIGHGDVTFKGTDGMKGATVSVWDHVSGGPLGSVTLDADGPWEMTVRMTFDRWVVRAKQVIDGRESADSDSRVFNVVLLTPEIEVPAQAGTLTRTSTIEGTGEPLGYVDVFLGNSSTPFLEKVRIGDNGRWQAEATMPVGDKTIRARQYFQSQISKDTQPRTYKVVPHSPFMETPAVGDHVGKRAMVSGFGVPGDKVKVKLGPDTGPALGEALVGEDRTWSIPVEILRAGPAVSLVATSSEGAFESAASAPRSVLAGIFEPTIQSPAEGRPVLNPVHFAGTGRDGEAQLCSWYNPDVIQTSVLPVTTATGWQGAASIALSPGGNWSVIQQTLTKDQDGATVSDKVTSHRFEVDPVPSEGKSSDVPDKWSP